MKIGIVVTGLPASGKTTIARSISTSLLFDLVDKDDFLEDLYELNEVRTWEDRKKLSRQSDVLFQAAAEMSGSVVLVSHWKPLDGSGESGTATDWLQRSYTSLIEVYCHCPPDQALNRFLARERHPSHFDKQRNPTELAMRLRDLESRYPLGIGSLIKVHTDAMMDHSSVVDQVRLLIENC